MLDFVVLVFDLGHSCGEFWRSCVVFCRFLCWILSFFVSDFVIFVLDFVVLVSGFVILVLDFVILVLQYQHFFAVVYLLIGDGGLISSSGGTFVFLKHHL